MPHIIMATTAVPDPPVLGSLHHHHVRIIFNGHATDAIRIGVSSHPAATDSAYLG
jgi:hypothetical protein